MSPQQGRATEAKQTSAALNDFALRSFRDVADHDYIAARLAFRYALYSQFHWAALQTVEKYLKGIFVLNRVSAKNLGHDLGAALERAAALPFELRLSPGTLQFIGHLDRFGRYRYLESSYHVVGPEIARIDRAVWEIRRYCQQMNYDVVVKGRKKNLLQVNLASVEGEDSFEWRRVSLHGGVLEAIVKKKDHVARQPLIWKNLFFGSRKRRSASVPWRFHATNAPLALRPELIEEVLKYVQLPKAAVDASREEMGRRAEKKGKA